MDERQRLIEEIRRNASRGYERSQQRQQEQRAASGGGGFLFGHDPSAWLSELGGSAGAVKGAALGSVLGVPGMIGGGVLGAFLGGTLGSGGEQVLRDKDFSLGKAISEGRKEAPWGALQGVGKAFKIGRAAGAADDIGRWAALTSRAPVDETMRGLGLLDDAGRAVTKEAFKTARGAAPSYYDEGAKGLKRAGQRQVAQARGITRGVGKTATRPGLTGKAATNVNTWLDSKGLTKGSADKMLGGVESIIDDTGRQLDAVLKTSSKKLPKGTIQSIRNAVDDYIAKTPGIELTKGLQDDLAKLGRTRSTRSLTAFKRNLDDVINYTRGSASVDPKAERGLKALRRQVSRALDGIDPRLTSLNDELSKAYTAQGLLQDQVKKSGASLPFGVRVPARMTQNLQNKAGRAMQFAGGGAPGFSGGRVATLGRQHPLAKQIAARGIFGGGAVPSPSGMQQPELSEEDLMLMLQYGITPEMLMGDQDPLAQDLGGFTLGEQSLDPAANAFGQQAALAPQQPQMVIPREAMTQAMMTDLMETGGENIDTMMKLFEFANADALAAQAAVQQGGADNLTADQQKKLTNLGQVDAQLSQLEAYVDSGMFPETNQLAASLGGFYDKTVGRLTDTDKKIFQDQLRSRGIQVIRAMGEVGNLTEAEQTAAIRALPSPGDTSEGARQKLAILRDLFARVRDSALTFGGYTDQQSQGQYVAPMQFYGGGEVAF